MPTAISVLGLLNRRVPALGLALFRALFGVSMLLSTLRYGARGWITEQLSAPSFHFTYLGFGWVRPLPAPLLHATFALMAVAALALALGLFTRVAAVVFFVAFTYVELIDKATYLNHYYLVSLLAFLLIFLPSNAVLSLDARLGLTPRREFVGGWTYDLLRIQLSLVYFFAGLAKLNADWLVSAEPLRSWLFALGDAPLVGPLLREAWVAHAMSIAGAIFDVSAGFLFWRRSVRGYVYAAAALFHLAVWALFPIGIFSLVMLVATTLYLEPDWPRVLGFVRRLAPASQPNAASTMPRPLGTGALAALGAFVLLQAALPLRFLAYPGNPNWSEDAFRFAWRVMLLEKSGSAEFRVVTPEGTTLVRPRDELTALQVRMLSTQPDMIHEYALHLAERFRSSTGAPPHVYADAWASLNGRPSQRLIDPQFDLVSEPRSLGPARYVVPLESSHTAPPLDPRAESEQGVTVSGERRIARK